MFELKKILFLLLCSASLCFPKSSFWGGLGLSVDDRAGGTVIDFHYIPSNTNVDFILEFNNFSEQFMDMNLDFPVGREYTYDYFAAMAGVGYFWNIIPSLYIEPYLLFGRSTYDYYVTDNNKYDGQLPNATSFVGQAKLPLGYSFSKYFSLTIFTSLVYDGYFKETYSNSGLEINIGAINVVER